MVDRPIIFSGPMVRALLDGRKSQTRRLAWRFKEVPHDDSEGLLKLPSPWQKAKPGDRLWVRENFRYTHWDEDGIIWVRYEADGAESDGLTHADDPMELIERLCAKLDRAGVPINGDGYQSSRELGITPCIHMPRWASRLTLVVTAVKVERLQAISDEDVLAEGVSADNGPGTVAAFMDLWNSLHGADAWAANPEVVALTFTVHRQNIDALAKEAA